MKSMLPQSLAFSHCFMIGIKGVGMAALAQCLLDAGIKVSGCDVTEIFVTEKILSTLDIVVDTIETTSLPTTADCVIYGSAHQGIQHPLVQEAIARNIPVFSHAQMLGLLSQEKQTIAVCGVGGKSTTSAWIAWTLDQIGAHPSYQIGVGEIIGLPRTGRWDAAGTLFVVEADEYAENPQEFARGAEVIPRFHYLQPNTIICTNLLYDHPDVYSSFADTEETFFKFFCQIKPEGTIIWNADDANLRKLIQKVDTARPDVVTLSFGTTPNADLRISDLGFQQNLHRAQFISQSPITQLQSSPVLSFSLPGLHNLQNAAAVWIATCLLNNSATLISQHITSFKSTSRRFQFIRQINSTYFFDDYAHHPTEIAAILSACKAQFPTAKLVVIFQPHTFSRTKALLSSFATAFNATDVLILTPIFGSAREKSGGITENELATAIRNVQSNQTQVIVAKSLEAAAHDISKLDLFNTVVITLGAGDVYLLHSLLPTKAKP